MEYLKNVQAVNTASMWNAPAMARPYSAPPPKKTAPAPSKGPTKAKPPLPPRSEVALRLTKKKIPRPAPAPSSASASACADGEEAEQTRHYEHAGRSMEIPDMANSTTIDISQFDRIREICDRLFLPGAIYPDGAIVASMIMDNDIRPTMGRLGVGPQRITSINPVHFQTIQRLRAMYPAPEAPLSSSGGGGSSSAGAGMINLRIIEPSPRAYEDMQLYPPAGNERKCVADTDCIVFKTTGWNFVMKEFLTPREADDVRESGQHHVDHKPCLVCVRDSCLFHFALSVSNDMAPSPNKSYQPHRNIVDVEGEYSYYDCIPTSMNFLFPMVMNRLSAYKFHRANGIPYLTQDGFAKVTKESLAAAAASSAIPARNANAAVFRRGAPQAKAAAAAAAASASASAPASGGKRARRAKAPAPAAVGELDPYISAIFCSVHVTPMDHEERRGNMAPGEIINLWLLPPSSSGGGGAKHELNGTNPTSALLYFARHYIPVAHPLRRHLVQTLLLDLAECVAEFESGADDYYSNPTIEPQREWTFPCGHHVGCRGLCAATAKKFTILMATIPLIHKLAPKRSAPRLVNHVWAHVDSHWPMLNAVDYILELRPELRPARADDDSAFRECPAELWRLAYASVKPNLQYALTGLSMPDASILVPWSIATNAEAVSSKRLLRKKFPQMTDDDLGVLMAINSLMYKLVPERSNMREPSKSIRSACEKHPRMVEFNCKLIIASCLGIYETCATKMPLALRIHFYRYFYTAIPRDEAISVFTAENTTAVISMAKEYYYEMTQRMPGFTRAMKTLFDWDKYSYYMNTINEVVRRQLVANVYSLLASAKAPATSTAILQSMDIFSGVSEKIMQISEEYRVYQRLRNINYNIQSILSRCINKNYKQYELSLDEQQAYVPGQEHHLRDPSPTLAIAEDVELMREVLDMFPAGAKIPLDILVLWGASVDAIADMKQAVFAKLPEFERSIAALDPENYAIFFTFFRLCASRNRYAEIPIDVLSYYHQMHTLIKSHKLADGDTIPAIAGKIQVCDNCANIKQASFFSRDVKNKHSNGRANVMVTGDGITVCACRPQSARWRDLYYLEHGERAPALEKKKMIICTEATRRRKFAKKVSMQIKFNRCNRTPTRTLDALGKVAMFDGVPYVACFEDLRVLPLEKMRYLGARLLCPECYDRAMRPKPAAQAPVAGRLLLREKGEDGCSLLGASAGEQKCEYCGNRPYNDRYREFFLFDDCAEAKPCFRRMRFCLTHGSLQWIVNNEYTRKSDVMTGISEKWNTTAPSGAFISCKTPK